MSIFLGDGEGAQGYVTEYEALLEYRRSVAALYADIRRAGSGLRETWMTFRRRRDELFKHHPQSALSDAQKATFSGLSYFDYDPALRFLVHIDTNVKQDAFDVELEEDGLFRYKRIGRVSIHVAGREETLSLFWVMGYGGGLFLPFRDVTNADETYGGGRYLLDTIKHADLGHEGDWLILDFNYAYNPSCAYNDRWHCPLAPVENRLSVAIRAGERSFRR